ncbi:MAG TPA: hypothetical protein VF950_02415 [Planctomycetota bacterium]
MNPRALLCLLLAGCATPERHEPTPLPPATCPMGHAELRPGPVGRGEVRTFESEDPAPTGLVCGRCGYALYPNNRVWIREAASLEGFAPPPSALLRRLHERSPDARELKYSQTSAGNTRFLETLAFTSANDLWPILREELDAAGARGGVSVKGSHTRWEGRLGDLELTASLSGGRLRVTLRPPVSQADIDRAFRDALKPR